MMESGDPTALNVSRPDPGGLPIRRRGWRQRLLMLCGLLCVMLGLLGAVLPLLPTTPFLLVAAACFERSSPRLQRWLFSNRLFGDALRRYRNGEGMPRRSKIVLLVMLWGAVGFSLWRLASEPLWWLLLLLICGAVTVHILRIPCRR